MLVVQVCRRFEFQGVGGRERALAGMHPSGRRVGAQRAVELQGSSAVDAVKEREQREYRVT